MTELHDLSALEQRNLLASGELEPTGLVEHYLDRIAVSNPELHALVTVTRDQALEKAQYLETAAGSAGRPSVAESPLWGMPFADKDLNDRAGVPSSYGSRAFEGYIPQASSPIVLDLDAAGGVSLGKTNVPEFGFPAYARNLLAGGYPRNPWDTGRDAGGSSSGAAAAVAAHLLPFAPGNDAGGSVRIPAAACGLVGLKPSRGRVPGESGIASLAGLAVGGPLARSVEDAALLLDGMSYGQNRYSLRAPDAGLGAKGTYVGSLDVNVRPLRIGWNTWSPWASRYDIQVDPALLKVFEETKELLGTLGHELHFVEPTPAPEFVDAFRAVWMSSAASLPFEESLLEQVEPLTQWLVRMGRSRPAADLPRALAALSHFEAQIIQDYSDFDVVLTPALAMTPRPVDWYDQSDGEANFMQQCQYTPFTSYLNAAGLPALALPVGQVPPGENQGAAEPAAGVQLPAGIQVIGRPGDERTLLQLGKQLQEVLRWTERVAPTARLQQPVSSASAVDTVRTEGTGGAKPAGSGASAQEFWDERYASSAKLWSGKVNSVLSEVAAKLKPGRALDLGCGEGGDVLWLAAQGWEAFGVDISPTAVTRARSEAAVRGLAPGHTPPTTATRAPGVSSSSEEPRENSGSATFSVLDLDQLADVVASGELPDSTAVEDGFDLVTASFLQSPVHLERQSILSAAAELVKPGGVFLITSHAERPPWVKPPVGSHGVQHGPRHFPTPDSELADLQPKPEEWRVLEAEVRNRIVARDGEEFVLADTVVLLQRL